MGDRKFGLSGIFRIGTNMGSANICNSQNIQNEQMSTNNFHVRIKKLSTKKNERFYLKQSTKSLRILRYVNEISENVEITSNLFNFLSLCKDFDVISLFFLFYDECLY